MQIKSVLPWQIMPGDKILHKIEGIVQVTFIRPDGNGGTYFEYYDRCGPFDRVLKVVDQGGLF